MFLPNIIISSLHNPQPRPRLQTLFPLILPAPPSTANHPHHLPFISPLPIRLGSLGSCRPHILGSFSNLGLQIPLFAALVSVSRASPFVIRPRSASPNQKQQPDTKPDSRPDKAHGPPQPFAALCQSLGQSLSQSLSPFSSSHSPTRRSSLVAAKTSQSPIIVARSLIAPAIGSLRNHLIESTCGKDSAPRCCLELRIGTFVRFVWSVWCFLCWGARASAEHRGRISCAGRCPRPSSTRSWGGVKRS